MSSEQALPSVEELDAMESLARVADRRLHRKVEVFGDNLDKLVRAARLVPVLMAERDAYKAKQVARRRETDDKYRECVEAHRRAMEAADAALARAGVQMGGTR